MNMLIIMGIEHGVKQCFKRQSTYYNKRNAFSLGVLTDIRDLSITV